MTFNQRARSSFLAGLWLASLTVAALAAQSPVPIHPIPPPSVERPRNIVVLADGFTNGEKEDFDEAVANFFTYGLLVDDDYKPYADLFTVKTIFNPVTTSGASQFGFTLVAGATNCSINWVPDGQPSSTSELINTAATGANPTHIVVIGNHNFNFGCSHGLWTYVAVGAVGEQILQHELGHQIGFLKDEYAVAELATTSPTEVYDSVNCSTLPFANPTIVPQWMNTGLSTPPPITNPKGCALYGEGVVHAFDMCRMGVHGPTFCALCTREMKKTWDEDRKALNVNVTARAGAPGGPQILRAGFAFQAPTPPPNRQVRLLANLDRASGRLTLVAATDVNGRVAPHQRRLGNLVYEIWEGARALDVGVISGDPFSSHGYRGAGTQHTRVPGEAPRPSDTASIVIPIGDVSKEELLRPERSVEIRLYRLAPQVREDVISMGVWDKLRAANQITPLGTVTPAQLKGFLVSPGKVVAPDPAKKEPVPARKEAVPPRKGL